MMPHLSLLEKCKQHFQLGQYLHANGLQTFQGIPRVNRTIHSTHTDEKRSFDHNTSVCFDATVCLYSLLFLCQVPLLLEVWLNTSHVKTWLNLLMFLMMMTFPVVLLRSPEISQKLTQISSPTLLRIPWSMDVCDLD